LPVFEQNQKIKKNKGIHLPNRNARLRRDGEIYIHTYIVIFQDSLVYLWVSAIVVNKLSIVNFFCYRLHHADGHNKQKARLLRKSQQTVVNFQLLNK